MNKPETRAHSAGLPNKVVPQQLASKDAQLSLTNLIHDGKSFTARSEHPTRDWA